MNAAFLRDLRAKPAATVSLFRNLLLHPASEMDRPKSLLLAGEFCDLLINENAAEHFIGKSAWNATLSAGLPQVYVDVVSARDFFKRPLVRISYLSRCSAISLPRAGSCLRHSFWVFWTLREA